MMRLNTHVQVCLANSPETWCQRCNPVVACRRFVISPASAVPERKILECATHPFLVKMHYAFQTSESLYIVMGFANGGMPAGVWWLLSLVQNFFSGLQLLLPAIHMYTGELFSHLKKEKRFSEDRARFYAAEIALGLEYLHDGGVVYRCVH